MKRYIKASVMSNAVTDLQNKSNELVDAIIQLMDNYPAMEAYVKKMDSAGGYDDPNEYESEFKNDVGNVTWEIGTIIDDINRIIDFYNK